MTESGTGDRTVVMPRKNTSDLSSDTSPLPFTPFEAPLERVIRQKYIKNVAVWLLGSDDNSVLAQVGNSVWETALTIRFLSDASEIFEEAAEEPELRRKIDYKVPVVARWLMSKLIDHGPEEVSWERVTWDTCVTIHALMIALKKFPSGFSENERREIIAAIRRGASWLCRRFGEWETLVKYPFGPADVAQIVVALLHLTNEYPDIYQEVRARYSAEGAGDDDIIAEIIRYLLHKKTEKTLTIETTSGEEDVLSYWWDDYFSTAEVVEALARFHEYYGSSEALSIRHGALLQSVKEALVRACSYFEHGQVDGMWGAHIDTIKVIYSYVIIRRLIPQRDADKHEALIVPEVHTTFKALRWLCDEKQIFADGSFLHTMFLTIFYALALVEIHRSWDPCHGTVANIYDDVVWFSPVRTTPERSKRLAAELENGELRSELEREKRMVRSLQAELSTASDTRRRLLWSGIAIVAAIPLFLASGALLQVATPDYNVLDVASYLAFVGVFVPVLFALLAVIWKYAHAESKTVTVSSAHTARKGSSS